MKYLLVPESMLSVRLVNLSVVQNLLWEDIPRVAELDCYVLEVEGQREEYLDFLAVTAEEARGLLYEDNQELIAQVKLRMGID